MDTCSHSFRRVRDRRRAPAGHKWPDAELRQEENGRRVLHVYPGVGHLLTRSLANQESDFDPDPVARKNGNAKQLEFLRGLWFR